MGDLEGKLDAKEQFSLGELSNLAATVSALLAKGLSVSEVAEHIVSVVDPALEPDIATLVTVLTEVQKLLGAV